MDDKKMKCGDIRVAMEEEPVIWMDRKRVKPRLFRSLR